MKKIPKISIIVPVYNVENYLKNCIESILSQTFKDFEIILVNDGSTDTSYDICKYYLNIDSRVKVINKVNEGVSSARNTGLDVAIGEYIGFVDSDDYIHPQMYEILYNYISNTQSDIAQCDYKKTYNTYDKESVNFIKLDEDTIGKSILQYSNIESLNQFYDKHGMKFTPAWNKLYRKELFKKHRYKVGKNHEDEFIMHELLYESKKVIYIPVELYFYLQSENSIMRKPFNLSRLDALEAYSERAKFFENINEYELYKKALFVYSQEFFRYYFLMKNNIPNCKQELKIIKYEYILNLFKILGSVLAQC